MIGMCCWNYQLNFLAFYLLLLFLQVLLMLSVVGVV